MHLSRMLRFAVPLMMAAIILVPAATLVINGRNIQDLESLDPGNLTPLTEWVLRLTTIGIVGLCGLVLVERGLGGGRRSLDRSQLALMAGFLAYFVGTTLVPGLFGSVPGLSRNVFYVLVLFLAVFARRGDGIDPLLETLKWTLLVLFLASFGFAVANPNAALRTYAPELRLPLVPFRFWGLGSSSNSIGPMGLALTLMLMARPFARGWVNRLGHASAALVVLLAQSQTTWIAGAMIVPAMWLYRRSLRLGGSGCLAPPPGFVLALAGIAGMALILGLAALIGGGPVRVEPTPGLTGYGEAFTGRGNIWRIAINTFLDSPLFGYGPTAWDVEFRQALRMPFATSAHNQILQALSVGGLFGLTGLVLYLVALIRGAAQRGAASLGLAPALLALTLVRSFSEAPLELGTLLFADMVMHVLLLALLLDRSWQAPATLATEPSMPGRPRDRRQPSP